MLQITQTELQNFVNSLNNPTQLQSSGINLGGVRYIYLSGGDNVWRGKKGQGGVHVAKSKTTIVVGVYNQDMQPGQAANAVEKMAEYLAGQNY